MSFPPLRGEEEGEGKRRERLLNVQKKSHDIETFSGTSLTGIGETALSHSGIVLLHHVNGVSDKPN